MRNKSDYLLVLSTRALGKIMESHHPSPQKKKHDQSNDYTRRNKSYNFTLKQSKEQRKRVKNQRNTNMLKT